MLLMSRRASAQTDRGINVHDRSGRGGWFPAGRQQRAEIVLVGHARQAFEHVGEVGFRVVAVALGTFHHGIDDRGALAGGFTAHEEPGLFPNRRRPDAILEPVGVYLKMAVMVIDVEPVQECQRVVDGLAQHAFGQTSGRWRSVIRP